MEITFAGFVLGFLLGVFSAGAWFAQAVQDAKREVANGKAEVDRALSLMKQINAPLTGT